MIKFIGIIKRSEAIKKMKKASNLYKNCERSKYYFHIQLSYKDIYIPCSKYLGELYEYENINVYFIKRLSTYIKLYLTFYDGKFSNYYSIIYRGNSKGFRLIGSLFAPTRKENEQVFPTLVGFAYVKDIFTSSEVLEFLKYDYFNVIKPKSVSQEIYEKTINTFVEKPVKSQCMYAQMYFEKAPDIKMFVNITEALTKEEQENIKANCFNNFKNVKVLLTFNEYTGAKIEKIFIKEGITK